jgi:hypothetical protein
VYAAEKAEEARKQRLRDHEERDSVRRRREEAERQRRVADERAAQAAADAREAALRAEAAERQRRKDAARGAVAGLEPLLLEAKALLQTVLLLLLRCAGGGGWRLTLVDAGWRLMVDGRRQTAGCLQPARAAAAAPPSPFEPRPFSRPTTNR